MRSHYAITGPIRYYRTRPTQVELGSVADGLEPEIEPMLFCIRAKPAMVSPGSDIQSRLSSLSDQRLAYPDSAVLAIAEAGPYEGPFDFARWKDPPHVALANLQDELKAVLRFTRKYGVLASDYKGQAKTISVGQVLHFRNWLRAAWELEEEALRDIFLHMQVAVSDGDEIVPNDLWTLVRMMFKQDLRHQRTRKCGNPDCPAPYFLAVRKSHKFCSQKCAVLINVRHFREREAQGAAKRGK